MTNDKQRKALLSLGKQLKRELDQAPVESRPEIDRALRRLLERDISERSRPRRLWSGDRKG